jgi:hypothetical protein
MAACSANGGADEKGICGLIFAELRPFVVVVLAGVTPAGGLKNTQARRGGKRGAALAACFET